MNEFVIKNGFISQGDSTVNGGFVSNTISATTYYNLPIDVFTGGTVTGPTNFTGGLTVNTISATTYYNLPIDVFTGGTVTGPTNFTGGLTVNTISATTYYTNSNAESITVGENVVAGNLLFLSGDSKYYKVNNSSESFSSTELRIAISTITANQTGYGLVKGDFITTGLTAGAKYWVGDSGDFSISQPTTDNSIVRLIGTALSTTKLVFNPDQTYIEISDTIESYSGTVRSITTSQTALATDKTIICLNTLTLTIPTAVGIQGVTYNIKSRTTGTITINSTGGQLFDDDTSLSIIVKNTNITIQSDGTNWIII